MLSASAKVQQTAGGRRSAENQMRDFPQYAPSPASYRWDELVDRPTHTCSIIKYKQHWNLFHAPGHIMYTWEGGREEGGILLYYLLNPTAASVSVDVKHSHDDVMMKDISHHHHHHHHSAGRMSGKHRPALTMSFIFSAHGHTLGDYYSNRRVKRTGMPAGDDMSGRQRTCARPRLSGQP
ncbi:uncharacterized protein K489DRAFT_38358 [Dissoconium aciculare CBS 342.82]|uniref:Uncharacterized protein n=1 Tax=Dissoconium aciculare CBS 342.82 TaxID=1314786 RepID=A0A6J3LZD5_9PEZI|nr:uncharacterized protein K489DRAFT_38358 [Dissoconium aciculare CBS 342.82]KAF1820634.1 hypothetical protein K489DRAFT_38358 [Dissoconium aciculare CBS 342.82]